MPQKNNNMILSPMLHFYTLRKSLTPIQPEIFVMISGGKKS